MLELCHAQLCPVPGMASRPTDEGVAVPHSQAMKMGSEVYHHLKAVIKKKYGQDACNVGDEGGFAPNILENKEGLDLVVAAIEAAGYTGQVIRQPLPQHSSASSM